MYWNTVTPLALQSLQNWEAENFFLNTQVAPRTHTHTHTLYIVNLVTVLTAESFAPTEMAASSAYM